MTTSTFEGKHVIQQVYRETAISEDFKEELISLNSVSVIVLKNLVGNDKLVCYSELLFHDSTQPDKHDGRQRYSEVQIVLKWLVYRLCKIFL